MKRGRRKRRRRRRNIKSAFLFSSSFSV